MNEPASTPPADRSASAREAIMHRVRSSVTDGVVVVNSVRAGDLPDGVLRSAGTKTSTRRHRRHAEQERIDFTAWSTIPWRDRPYEARLADVAHDIARAVLANPAWHHDLLDTHRVRLDPVREAADIAYAAYRLYELRLELGPRPAGPDNPVLARAQALFGEHFTALTMTWNSLVDRVAALAAYQAHLAEFAPIVAALAAVRHLEDVRLDADMTALYTDAARNDLAANDTRDLQGGVDSMSGALVTVMGLLSTDVRDLAALSGREPGNGDPSSREASSGNVSDRGTP